MSESGQTDNHSIVAPNFSYSKGMIQMSNSAKVFTITEVAERINVSPRTIRKVLRSAIAKENQPGKGGRWAIRETDIAKVTELCATFTVKDATIATFE